MSHDGGGNNDGSGEGWGQAAYALLRASKCGEPEPRIAQEKRESKAKNHPRLRMAQNFIGRRRYGTIQVQ
jgi:hypothetical protein